MFNTGESQDALLKYSIKARSLSNNPVEQLDLVNAPEFKSIMDDVQVHGESLGSILTPKLIGDRMEWAVNSDMAKYFNQGNFSQMDIPQAVRVDLEDLYQQGYRFIGQATTRRVSNWNPLTYPDYLFVKRNNLDLPDKNSLIYWDSKHFANGGFSTNQNLVIVDPILSGGHADVRISNIPATIKGIGGVNETVVGVSQDILNLANGVDPLKVTGAFKIGSSKGTDNSIEYIKIVAQ